jgi:hypothetical protein
MLSKKQLFGLSFALKRAGITLHHMYCVAWDRFILCEPPEARASNPFTLSEACERDYVTCHTFSLLQAR